MTGAFLSQKVAWWRHQMDTFAALLVICARNSQVPGDFPAQRPVTRSFDVFFDLHPNKRFSKQSWGWWFETSSPSLWRHCNGLVWWGDVMFSLASSQTNSQDVGDLSRRDAHVMSLQCILYITRRLIGPWCPIYALGGYIWIYKTGTNHEKAHAVLRYR